MQIIQLGAFALFMFLYVRSIRRMFDPPRAPESEPPEFPQSRDPRTVSEWLHRVLTNAYAYEREPWARERIARVENRLQASLPLGERMQVELLWIPEVTAFTFPGRYIYVSRRLLERVDADEPIAFVVAHEIAHHALGHMRAREQWMKRLSPLPGADIVALTALQAASWFVHPVNEMAADEYALRLCADAGYDPRACIRVMDVLEMDSLDWGNVTAVCGPEPSDAEIAGRPKRMDRARRWLWDRERGYPSLLARKQHLRQLAATLAPPAAR